MPVKKWSERILLVELSDDPEFTEDIVAAIDRAEKEPTLDAVLSFDAVSYINSSNLAKLLKLRRIMIQSDRSLRLCSVNSHVWGVFLSTGLDKIFEFSDDVSTALATLQIARGGEGKERQAADV